MTIAAQPDPLSLTARPMLIDTGIYEDVLGDIDFGSLTDVDSIGTTVVTVDIYTMHGAASLDSSHAVAGSITESSVALAGIEVEKGGSKVRLVGTFADLATAFDDALKYQTEADWNILCCGSDTAKITTSFISPIDGSTQTSSYSINIAPLAVNDVPVITNTAAGGQLECDEDSSDLTLSAIEVADTDIGEGFATMLRATFSADQGTFSCDDTCKASGMYYLDSENTDASTLTFRAGVDVLPVLFAQIRYSPNSDYAGNDDLTVTIDDLGNTGALQNGQTASQTYTIVVNPVNDGLIMSLPAAATGGALPRWTLSEDVSETLSIALTDIDNTMDDITVVFQCTHCAAISVTSTLPTTTNAPPTGDSQSVSLTLSDNAVSTDTLTVTYLSASNWNSVFKGLDKIAITLTDAAGAGTLYTIEVLVDAVDDAPVIVNPFSASGVTLDEDVPYYFEGMSIADVESDDILDDLLTVVLEVDNGILSLNSSVGMYITSGGNSQSTITFKGTVSNINNAIDGLSYLSSTDYSGADQLDITVSDGTTDVTSAIVLTVNAINDPPELGIPSSLQTNEGATESLAWTVSDTDAYISVLTLVVECDESAGMTFDFAEVDNEVHVLDTSDAYILMSDTEAQYTTLITSITLQGTQDQLTKALDGFTYTNLDSVSKSSFIRMSLSDHGARGGGENYTVSATVPVYITHINDAPTVEFASAGSFDLYEDVTTVVAGMIVVDTDVDEDFNALIRLKLSVTGGATLSVEALYTEGLVVLDGAALTGVDTLEVRGALEYINVFIAKVQYTSAAHWTGADTLTVAVFDNGHSGTGGEGSNSYAYTINVLPVNDVIAVQAPLDSPYNAMPLLQVTEDVATHLDGLQLEDNEFVHTG